MGRTPNDGWPVWGMVALGLILVGAGWANGMGLPLPPCTFRTLTGVPCAFCGTTRAAAAVSWGDLEAALRLNPLACLGGMVVVHFFLCWILDRLMAWRTVAASQSCLGRLPWRWLGAVFVMANWAYVVLTQTVGWGGVCGAP